MKRIRKDQVLVGAIFLVILATFVLVVYLPQSRQFSQLRRERQQTADALHRDRVNATELARLKGELKNMTDRLHSFNQRLPDQQELGQFLKDISSNARSAGLEGSAIQPQPVQQAEMFLQMPIKMEYKGNFMELFRFLRQAHELTRLTHIQALSVRNSKKLDGQCDIDVVMTIYFTKG